MADPARTRANSRRTTAMMLMREIQRADCWADINLATSALFHANLIWKKYDDAMRVHESEPEDAGAPPESTARKEQLPRTGGE